MAQIFNSVVAILLALTGLPLFFSGTILLDRNFLLSQALAADEVETTTKPGAEVPVAEAVVSVSEIKPLPVILPETRSAEASRIEVQTALLAATGESRPTPRKSILKGWDHLFEVLVEEGSDPTTVAWLLSDPRMPSRETLYFSLNPREPHSIYRRLNTARNRRNALGFYADYEDIFLQAERTYQVPRAVILALIQIETACGKNTGRSDVFFRLARLASAAAPENIEQNFLQKQRSIKLLHVSRVEQRAVELQKLFLRHTAATIDVAKQLGVHPLELKGSSAGAIGIPQFLPGNVSDFGADGDRDGIVDVFHPPDAIMSVARFLNGHGWKYGEKLQSAANRAAIYSYNRSDPYVNTALAMAAALQREMPPPHLRISGPEA